jgi:hypothetical protein
MKRLKGWRRQRQRDFEQQHQLKENRSCPRAGYSDAVWTQTSRLTRVRQQLESGFAGAPYSRASGCQSRAGAQSAGATAPGPRVAVRSLHPALEPIVTLRHGNFPILIGVRRKFADSIVGAGVLLFSEASTYGYLSTSWVVI